jgi:Arc/MetJ-type ribon-helix-helix transcriptional regulator
VSKYTPEGALADNMMIFLYEYKCMSKASVEVPQELPDDLDEHVGDEGKFVNWSDAIRASTWKTLDMLDEIDERHGRIETDGSESH